jgi:hypothetical protein
VEHSARGFFRSRGKSLQYYTGERWTKQLIAFLWTHSHTLWKDRCAVAHAPAEDSPDNSSARSRQAAQQRVETAYAYAPLMLACDQRVLDVPLEERLKSRTSALAACVKTIFPVINQSVRDARAEIHTGHLDIRSYFSDAAAAATATTTRPITATETRPARTNGPILAIRQRFQGARTRIATISADIRQFFPGGNSAA